MSSLLEHELPVMKVHAVADEQAPTARHGEVLLHIDDGYTTDVCCTTDAVLLWNCCM